MSFAGKWLELEIIMLTETSQTQKNNYHTFPPMCGNKKKTVLCASPFSSPLSLGHSRIRCSLPRENSRERKAPRSVCVLRLWCKRLVVNLTEYRITGRWPLSTHVGNCLDYIKTERPAHCGWHHFLAWILDPVSGVRNLSPSMHFSLSVLRLWEPHEQNFKLMPPCFCQRTLSHPQEEQLRQRHLADSWYHLE